MNDKYSLAKCEQYGRRLAAKVCNQFFGDTPDAALDGAALLAFTPIRQLNLLVLRQLLTQWQAEAAHLRSPYFNFEAPAVQAALGQFMNVLSRHIRLDRFALEPLLARATADTLAIVADPAGTFERILLGPTETPTAATLRDNLRYLEVDKAFFHGFIEAVPLTAGLTREFVTHRFALYHTANYKAHQPMERLVAELSSLLPLTAADLLEDGPVAASAAPVATVYTPVPTASVPVETVLRSSDTASRPSDAAPMSSDTVSRLSTTTSGSSATVSGPSGTVSRPSGTASGSSDTAPPTTASVPLYEKLKAAQTAPAHLAETLRASANSPSLGDRISPKIVTLREAISINQRLSFINELFAGESDDYHAAIHHLDALATADQARAYVSQDLGARYDWTRKEEHVGKLLKLIERKFTA